jgi:hypothetical protein
MLLPNDGTQLLLFLLFFRGRPNTCFDVVFFCSDLFDEATVSETPCSPSYRKKIGNFKLTGKQLRYNGYMQI